MASDKARTMLDLSQEELHEELALVEGALVELNHCSDLGNFVWHNRDTARRAFDEYAARLEAAIRDW